MMAKKKKFSGNSTIEWTGSRDLSVKTILAAKGREAISILCEFSDNC